MISRLAKADAEKLIKEGAILSFDEIVRLNALGLKAEKSARSPVRIELPRVVFFGDVIFYEPTIAHRLWIERAERSTGLKNDLSIMAYALTNEAHKLCNPDIAALVQRNTTRLFTRRFLHRGKLAKITLRQLENALAYVIAGNNPTEGERATKTKGEEETGSLAAGILLDGIALRIGSLADVSSMTVSEVARIAEYHRIENQVARGVYDPDEEHRQAVAEYCAALDEIKRINLGR